jgi:hypothetical protein
MDRSLPVDHPLTEARAAYLYARNQIKYGNKHGGAIKRACIINFNRARANLVRTIRKLEGRPIMQYTPSFTTSVRGIPCGVVVTHYRTAQQGVYDRLPEDCYPEQPAEIEWFLVDRNGYKAEWLERNMQPGDVESLCVEIEKRGGL